jgi:putative ABC transport system permease protein
VFWEGLRERIAALPEVVSASVMSGLPPIRRINANDMEIEGYVQDPDNPLMMNVDYWQVVARDYCETMRIPLVQGRLFGSGDVAGAPPVALINEAFARRFFGTGDPIGRRVHPYDEEHPWVTIVGVVRDVKQQGIDAATGTEIYLPQEQTIDAFGGVVSRVMNVVARTRTEPIAVATAIRGIVRDLDPSLAVAELRPLEEVVSRSLATARIVTVLLGVFSGLALLLAAVGIYGVMSYSVVRRTNEIGIRMALGADSGTVLAGVLREGLLLAAIGCAIGIGGAFVVTRWMRSLLFEVDPIDLPAFAASLAVLGLVALLACWVPARRATRVDPLVALRQT